MKNDFTARGFDTLSVDPLPEYRSEGIHLRHKKTGAEIYKVHADDEENLFSFTFRTPPGDHTGVSHILEHAVLCGSERYPLKDPFLVLLKGSAHTFLNAMTYPDKTVYPAASTVKADFINLLRVYGDAVFFPNLKKEAFEQEGHRLEFDDDGRLIRSGIVLNEMKGSYSSPESVAGDWTLRSIFPDSPYSWDSGGDPQHIPELTYEAFRDFHRSYYHPTNSRIFLYGNHDLDEVLGILDDEFLSRFDHRELDSTIPLQEPWSEPRRMTAYWPGTAGEDSAGKSTISMNWLWGESTDPRNALKAQILSYILLGHSGSPLQKAIIDSGLGEDISPVSGLESDLRQMVFSAALRGTDPDKQGDFESLVHDTLDRAAKGLDGELIEGALRTVEFRAREIRGGSPFGMRLMKRALRGWLHDHSPAESLVFDGPMADLRRELSKGFFEEVIRRDLLENPHRTTVCVSPDPEMQERRDVEESRQLSQIANGMTEEDRIALRLAEERLREFQDEVDSPEDLARIPFLSPSDLPKDVQKIPLICGSSGPVRWFSHETFSNGVSYLEMAFDLSGLDGALQKWMPLFGRSITDVGLPGMTHDEVARELAMKTGGLGCSLEASPIHPNSGGGLSLKMFVHLKALTTQWPEALDLSSRLLTSADFSDENRIRDLLVELRNDYRSAIVPSGHAFASLRAAAKHSVASSWEDLWYGIDQLQFLQKAVEDPDGVKKAVQALDAIRDQIICRNKLSLAVTSDTGDVPATLEATLATGEKLKLGSTKSADYPELFRHESVGEGLSTASAVAFSALSLPAPVLGSPEHARAGLLAHLLRTGYLWENIRMKGGAYGASASISGLEGTFTFSTYRDPVIVPSLEAFRKSLEWGRSLDDDTVALGIIGAVGRELRPMGPGERGAIAFKRELYGIDDNMRQSRRDVQLSASSADIRKAAENLLETWDRRSISVIAGKDALDAAAEDYPVLEESRIILPS